jgi:phenylalanyl-tRNA synthetase alpha chain
MYTRRTFLKQSLATTGLIAWGLSAPRFLSKTALATPPAGKPGAKDTILVVVQLTGGKTGSKGGGGSWSDDESKRALLRTHTTVTTIRYLSENPKPPSKVFGIGKVFRKEAIDATHLPEFHQVEGIVVEEGANFRMLQGVLGEFYKRMGFPQIKFRPSYYPYTEPSLDVAAKWGDRWLELGGAGIFRPEVTEPLGVPCPGLALGPGLERLAMLTFKLTDIRQLYISDVDWLRKAPIALPEPS